MINEARRVKKTCRVGVNIVLSPPGFIFMYCKFLPSITELMSLEKFFMLNGVKKPNDPMWNAITGGHADYKHKINIKYNNCEK